MSTSVLYKAKIRSESGTQSKEEDISALSWFRGADAMYAENTRLS